MSSIRRSTPAALPRPILSSKKTAAVQQTAKNMAAQALPDRAASTDQFEPAPKKGAKKPTTTGATAKPAAAQLTQGQLDAKKLKDVKSALKGSPTGEAAVKYLQDNKIPVKFANGGGSYWDGKNIVLDRTENTQEAALTLVHEINHAKADKTGTAADITKQTRADYVSTQLKEEVAGTVKSIQAKNELVASGKSVSATFPLESQYNTAYKKAETDFKSKNPKATATLIKTAAEKAGYNAVMKGFKDGSVVTSNTKVKYPDYYGNAWDKAHPKPAK
jgi:hypothetical protein